MKIVRKQLTSEEIQALAVETFRDMIKVVVDLKREILVAGGALHSDGEELLLKDGSKQADLWGANYFPARDAGKKIEYTSLINQYHLGNKDSQTIKDSKVRDPVKGVIMRYFGNV